MNKFLLGVSIAIALLCFLTVRAARADFVTGLVVGSLLSGNGSNPPPPVDTRPPCLLHAKIFSYITMDTREAEINLVGTQSIVGNPGMDGACSGPVPANTEIKTGEHTFWVVEPSMEAISARVKECGVHK